MARNGKDKNHMIGSVMSHSLLILERNKIRYIMRKNNNSNIK